MDFSPEFRDVYRKAVKRGWGEVVDIEGTYLEEVAPDEVRDAVINDVPRYIIEDAAKAGLRCMRPRLETMGSNYFTYMIMCKGPEPNSPLVSIEAEFTYDPQTWEVVLQRLTASVIKNPISTAEGEL